ncbi:MAG: MerR family transcriptional regulator [Acidobacteria bacterium]|nr:MerR family transcriptional regulator [Acidobacteriota bacterium]
MKIGELSERSGLPASRIRYYEANGLLPAADRAPNGYRDYDAAMVDRLRTIDLAKSLGFSLDEIARLLPGDARITPSCDTVGAALKEKLAAIDTHMDRLRETRARVEQAIRHFETLKQTGQHADVAHVPF